MNITDYITSHFIKASNTDPLIFSAGSVELQAASDTTKQPTVNIVAYSGGTMRVGGFGEVVLDLRGLDASPSVTLLADHRASIEGVVGSAQPIIENGQLIARGTLTSATEAGQTLAQLGRDGVQLQASIGAEPLASRRVREGETIQANGQNITAPRGGLLLVSRAKLKEISILPVGADSSSTTSIAAQGNPPMEHDTPTPSATTIDHDGIDRICAGTFAPTVQARVDELRIQAHAGEIDVKTLQAGVLEALRASRSTPTLAHPASTGIAAGVSERDALGAAFLIHAGYSATAEKAYGADAANVAVDLRCTSALDLCRAAITLSGQQIPRDTKDMIRAAFSTTSLPIAFGSSIEKTALQAFQDTPSTWRLFGRAMPVGNFREHRAVRPYHTSGRFSEVGADGELKHTAPTEETYPHSAKTHGRMFSITRQDIINDDIGAVLELARELGRQGMATVSDLFWTLVLSNPSNFFHDDNSNLLTGGGSALDIDALSDAIAKMRAQVDGDGNAIDINPFALVVPPDLEATARQIVRSTEVQRDVSETDNRPMGNPWRDTLQLGVESRLNNAKITGGSSTHWYLTANPANVPAVLVSFLNGAESPTVEQAETPANVLGVTWRGYIDVGVDPGDPRGAVRSAGA